MAEGLNQPNPAMAGLYQKHAALIEMFPDLNFTAIFADLLRSPNRHMSSDALAAFIIEHIDEMPKIPNAPIAQPQQQKHGTKRTSGDGGENDSYENYHSDDEYQGDRLIDKMFAEMVQTVKDQLQDETQRISLGEIFKVRKFLQKKFTLVRVEFIEMAFRAFDGHFVATCFACFFSQNSYIEYVKKLTQRLSDDFYVRNGRPLAYERRPKNVDNSTYSKNIIDAYAHYCALLEEYQRNYPQLLKSGIRLRANASTIRYHKDQEELMECLVCFDQVHFSRMISCQVSELTGMEEWKFDPDQPTSSATLKRRSTFQPPQGSPDKSVQGSSSSNVAVVSEPSKAAGISSNSVQPTAKEKAYSIETLANPAPKTNEQQEQPQKSLAPTPSQTTEEIHSFCRDCIRGQAQAATTDAPLAPGGLGLKCMVSDCTHILRYADIRAIIPRDVRKKLEERIVEENIGIAHIINLERCRKCNFAMEMDVPAEVNKVFDCFNCKARICRLCERDWDENHFGMSCEDLDKKMNHDRKLRDMERRMNEAIVRKCPRCGLSFVKESGCNKMTCRCGMKMCYLCRATNIDYTHFCQHMRDPTKKVNKCDHCTKPCLLYEDYRKKDENELEKIRMEGDLPTSSGAAAASSNGPTAPKMATQRLLDAGHTPRRRLEDALHVRGQDVVMPQRQDQLRANAARYERRENNNPGEDLRVQAMIRAYEDARRRQDQLRAAPDERVDNNVIRRAIERFYNNNGNNNNPVGLPAANNPIAAPDPPAAAANHHNNGPRDPRTHRGEVTPHHHRQHVFAINVQGNVQVRNALNQAAPGQDAPRDPHQIQHRHLLLPHPPRNIPFDSAPPVTRPYQFGGVGSGVNVNNGLLVIPNPNNNNNNNQAQRQQNANVNGHGLAGVGNRERSAERAIRNGHLNEIDREATNRLNELGRENVLTPYAGGNQAGIPRLVDISSSSDDDSDVVYESD